MKIENWLLLGLDRQQVNVFSRYTSLRWFDISYQVKTPHIGDVYELEGLSNKCDDMF